MKAIYKHLLKINEVHQTVQLPLNSTILSIQNQNEFAVLWAVVDIDETKTITVDILMIPTGEVIVDDLSKYVYLSTCQFMCGKYVCHYFIKYEYNEKSLSINNTNRKRYEYDKTKEV